VRADQVNDGRSAQNDAATHLRRRLFGVPDPAFGRDLGWARKWNGERNR